MHIDGRTRLCGLIGNPVEHTVSPAIHNGLAELYGHNLVYAPFLVKDSLRQAVEGAHALNVLGLNVTVPYKSSVIKYLTGAEPLAAQIGAVNTLVRTAHGYEGHNTDMPGLFRAMTSEGVTIRGEQVVILGAGGAARAVAFLCAREGAGHIYLLNRSLEKAEAVAAEVAAHYCDIPVTPVPIAEYERLPGGKYLAIQGTSVGLYPDVESAVITDAAFYAHVKTGYDLIYRPFETAFMKRVRAAGGTAFNGLKMLLYQGIIAYELWNGVSVSERMAAEIYLRMEKEMGIDV